ncbi:TonB-dependent siderophore receptor [Variovorax sp. HJSM1_2]|uniref:TonB-dependent siderophore receptor n=1 Tax=Variovorax sp. HJSM1_2 TaxID=3366263 RepID=UPI003BF4C4F3
MAVALRAVFAGSLVLGGLAANVSAQSPSAEQTRQDSREYNIPAGPLEGTLNRLGREAGVLISFGSAVTDGLRSTGVRGHYAVEEALSQALQGTGLGAVRAAGGGYTLRALPASAAAEAGVSSTLGTVTVTAASTRDARTDGTGSYSAGPSTGATGLNLSLRDTPQSVTVISRQQMTDQGSTTVTDVLRQVPGITANHYDSDRMSFNARGFAITNFQYDGVTKDYDGVYDWGATNSDMTIFDRVEVVKGATGLMSGTGDPSATVNFIRKRPTDKFTGSVTGSLGSWNDARTEVDLAGPLNAAGSLRGRVVGAYQDRDSYLDHYHQKKTVGYGVIEADLTRDTLLTAGVDYQHTDPKGSTWTGFPIFNSDGSRTSFDRSFNPATTWSTREMETRNLFATLEQRLAKDWKLKLSVNNESSQHRSLLGSASGGNPDPVTGEGMYFFSGDFQGKRTQNTLNASLAGQYELFGRKHDAMFGAMWSDTKTDGPWSESAYPPVPGSIFNWTGNYPQQAFPQTAWYAEHRRQTGFNAATRLRPADAWSVIVGARVSNIDAGDSRVYSDGVTPALSSSLHESGELTPYLGVVVDLNDSTSLYASYTSIFSPQSSRDANHQYLPAIKGKSAEAGVKGEFLDGRVNASLVAFHIQQNNVAEYVDFVDGESVYRAVQGVTSKGIEADVSGQIAPGWNLQAGYTYTYARDAQGQRVYGSTLMASQPEHVLRLNTSYRLPGDWNALTVGGGVSWQSAFYGKVWNPVLGDYAQVKQNGYALVNLMARYQINTQLSAALNIDNLFDKQYYSGFGLFDTGFYGAPRSAKVTLRYQF